MESLQYNNLRLIGMYLYVLLKYLKIPFGYTKLTCIADAVCDMLNLSLVRSNIPNLNHI